MSDPIRDLKRELLAAAERQHRSAPVATGLWGRLRAPRRVLLVAASVSVAAALALVVSAPWSHSPGLLEEAQAALTAPPDTIRHEKVEIVSTSTEAACTVTRGPSELWEDTKTPYRWRVLWRDLPMVEEDVPPGVTEPDCWKGVTSELGGTSKPVCTAAGCEPTLSFRAPNTLRISPISVGFPADPVQGLRDAIAQGLAHDEGTTQLSGRTVERIRLDPPPECDADQVCPPRRTCTSTPRRSIPSRSTTPSSAASAPSRASSRSSTCLEPPQTSNSPTSEPNTQTQSRPEVHDPMGRVLDSSRDIPEHLAQARGRPRRSSEACGMIELWTLTSTRFGPTSPTFVEPSSGTPQSSGSRSSRSGRRPSTMRTSSPQVGQPSPSWRLRDAARGSTSPSTTPTLCGSS